MSLLATTRAGVETAFTVAEEYVVRGTYYHVAAARDYDPVTDSMTSGQDLTTPNVRMMRVSVTTEEREASPLSVMDVKILIPGADLPRDPQESDTLLHGTENYNVTKIKPVPGNVLWILMCRKA